MSESVSISPVLMASDPCGRVESDTMLRKITVVVLTTLSVLLVALGTSASAATPTITFRAGCNPPLVGPERYSLWVGACGPSHVIRNTNYSYGVVVKNFGKRSFRRVKLTVIHQDPLTRSSSPYSHALRPDDAVWTLTKFKPDQVFRVNITLPFRQHNDPKGSNLTIEVRGYGPSERGGLTKDVTFIKK